MAVSELISLFPKGKLGAIDIEVIVEENHTDDLEITENPVQVGAAITDHSYMRPSSVVLRCGWSNASYAALAGTITSLFSGGGIPSAEYVAGVYSQLIALQQSREPFAITTTLRQYENMLIKSLVVTRDEKSSNILMVTATCREVRIVGTRSTSLPPKENQSEPEKTAEVEQAGRKQLSIATPAPGGSLPSSAWTVAKTAVKGVNIPSASMFG